jgi:hypothetical protein
MYDHFPYTCDAHQFWVILVTVSCLNLDGSSSDYMCQPTLSDKEAALQDTVLLQTAELLREEMAHVSAFSGRYCFARKQLPRQPFASVDLEYCFCFDSSTRIVAGRVLLSSS